MDADLTTLVMLQNSLEVPKILRYAVKSLVPTTTTTTTTNDTYEVSLNDMAVNTLPQGHGIVFVELNFHAIVSGEVRDMLLIRSGLVSMLIHWGLMKHPLRPKER